MTKEQLKAFIKAYSEKCALLFLQVLDYMRTNKIGFINMECEADWISPFVDTRAWEYIQISIHGGEWMALENAERTKDELSEEDTELFAAFFHSVVLSYKEKQPLHSAWLGIDLTCSFLFEAVFSEIHHKSQQLTFNETSTT